MSVQMKKGLFDPSTDALLIRGNMNGWGTGDTLKDANVDSIYTITLTPSTDPASFKFFYVHSSVDNWDPDPNRECPVPTGTSTYYAWFKNDSIYVQQYDISVTFSCNMELERLSGRFDPMTDTVSVNGDFNGWSAKTDIMTPNGLNPDIYEVTKTITRGVGENIQFKFWYTDNVWESVDNRVVTFTTENASTLTAEFSTSFNNGTLDNVINQACNITFTVNTVGALSQPSNSAFPAIDSVFIAGSALPLQWPGGGWPSGDLSKVIKLFDDGTNGDATASDGIYSNTLTIPAYTVLNFQYKYGINYAGGNIPIGDGNDNENSFGVNHTIAMTKYMTGATTVDTFGTMGATTLTNITQVAPSVEFQCNMSVQMKKGLFDPATDAVLIRGSMNSWGTADTLKDANVDSIYTITLAPGAAGETASFKFFYVHNSTDNWENDPNRSYLLPAGPSTYYAWFKDDSIFVQQYDISVTFSCNMELERLSGRFDPATDTVSVNGDFNGWSAKTDIMTPNGLNPDIYEVTKTITRGVGETINFKFWYTDNVWESVDNRVYTFTSENASSLTAEFSASFNNGTLDNVINQPCAITFTVNTVGAHSQPSNSVFPAIDSVFIAGSALPLQWPGGGWPSGDITKVIKMYDDGTNGDATSSDGIYSVNLTFPAYTVLNFQYKYGINYAGGNIPLGDGNDNENSFGSNHLMTMTRFMSVATTIDTFGIMGATHAITGQSTALQAGWNMISLPLTVADNHKTVLFPTAITSAFKYTGSYVEADQLDNGVGYWIKMPSTTTVSFTGTDVSALTIPVTSGWNLIGTTSGPVPVASITSTPPAMITSSFFGYVSSYVSVDTLYPGKAYWVKTNNSGTLAVGVSLSAEALAKQAIRVVQTNELPPSAPEESGSIVATIPTKFEVEKAYPNPFNPSTTIKYGLPVDAHVTVTIYNAIGQVVKTLIDENQSAGMKSVEWNAISTTGQFVPSGVYFYSFQATGVENSSQTFSTTGKMILLK